MAVVMAAAAAIGCMHMIVMLFALVFVFVLVLVLVLLVRVVFMAAMLVVHMFCRSRLARMIVRALVSVIMAASRGFARGCQSLFMQPLAACSVKRW